MNYYVAHDGGPCPVDDTVLVDIVLRDGSNGFHQHFRQAGSLRWEHEGRGSDIMFWCLSKGTKQ